MSEISEVIESEIADFFAGFGGPGEPDIQSGEAQRLLTERLLSVLAPREREEPEFYGPYTPIMMGAGVWVSIADELPPHLEGRKVWVSTRHPAPETVSRELMRAVVDAAWKHATESEEVPATTWADSIIDDVLSGAPPAPVVPDDIPEWLKDKLITICDMVEDNDEYCQDTWAACRAAMLKAPGKN
ncbi:hypothetical protein ACTV1I_002548 [Cronobacter dublinensis]